MEPRIVLSADPVIAGVTYVEGDTGQDNQPDHFEVTFEGGAETTQLTQFIINGDQDNSGDLSLGDVFFDIGGEMPGAGGHHEFAFDAANSQGISASDVLGVSVSDNGLKLIVNVKNFQAGDVFAFTIDVDEVETFSFDTIASGVEFEGSTFQTTFIDQHYRFDEMDISTTTTLQYGYEQTQTEGYFYDNYDAIFGETQDLIGTELNLSLDNEHGQSDRSAGAIDAFQLVPKPVTISGNVYHDENINCIHDAGEQGIGGVFVSLQRLNEDTGRYETVATTQTDTSGAYHFGRELNLMPGTFRLVEAQPDGFIDVGASAGTVEGQATGTVRANADHNENIITDIHIPLGNTSATNYDFKEVRPVSLSGNVWHDRNDDGIISSGEEGIANVLIRVTRLSGKDGSTDDVFASMEPIFIRTDANGHYRVDLLPPGIYEVVEINNYPPNENPLASFMDGKDSIGKVNGTNNGTRTNDKFSSITLCAGENGVEYNFGEIKPSSISGYVSLATPEGQCVDPSDPDHTGIAGVTMQLLDQNGNLVTTTQTDENGYYVFGDLTPGTYTVVEVQPDGYLDGDEHLGGVDGRDNGLAQSNDRFTQITLVSDQDGTNYNFCEHLPAELHGHVWHDLNDNGIREAGEPALGGVTIQLYDESGQLVAETQTMAGGEYWFMDLMAGTYTVKEIQPAAFTDGKDSVGSVQGITLGNSQNDMFMNVRLLEGQRGINYDFGEIRLGSISGMVHADVDDNCVFDASQGDKPLAGVALELLDANGNVIATTTTDENGKYDFSGLRPGQYSVREFTPSGYLDGDEMVGTINGHTVGHSENDHIFGVTLLSGQQAVNYDFCEHIPAEIHGTVWHDLNNDGAIQNGEEGIENVRIQLFDNNGNLIAETTTMAGGEYWFTDLMPGVYKIQEIQPGGYVDGKDALGNVGGVPDGQRLNDMFVNVHVKGGDKGVGYNFGEIILSSVSGFVHADMDGNCTLDANSSDQPLAGVVLELLNANGEVIATTTTAGNGFYQFGGLLPGEYSIREQQPEQYFDGGTFTGHLLGTEDNSNGESSTNNLISGIRIDSGQKLVQYNFCEHPAAEIHGRVWDDGPAFETQDGKVPENYRELRDGVYESGIDQPIAGVRMMLYYYIDPTTNEIAPRPVTLGEVMSEHYGHMNTNDPTAAVWVETMENGEYWFAGLQAGNYIVLQQQPDGYVDANEIPGTTTGFAFNDRTDNAPQTLTRIFSESQLMDTLINIRVNGGEISQMNNFTEVTALQLPPPPDRLILPPLPPQPVLSGNPRTPTPGITGFPGLYGSQPSAFTQFVGTRGGQFRGSGNPVDTEYTWHLSVVNGGQPRAVNEIAVEGDSIWQQASYITDSDWQRFDMTQGEFLFAKTTSVGDIVKTDASLRFGMFGGTPLAGDFDGDGVDEMAVYNDGYWMIDINRNGIWDDTDLIAKLGDSEDRPVVGDWDGDGKDDIGIYGPIWQRDPEAIARDPGLPNPDNFPNTKPKNVPPPSEFAATGARVMKLTSYGRQRVDVVDHVFGTGDKEDTPITGDWNGNGIRSIGYFHSGRWQFDINGDGKFDHLDASATFGRAGDIPLVGDFDGDGVEEIAVYRSGTWLIDTNGNRELDATDQTFHMGGASDLPVVGDWDGDGIDDPGLYRQINNVIYE